MSGRVDRSLSAKFTMPFFEQLKNEDIISLLQVNFGNALIAILAEIPTI